MSWVAAMISPHPPIIIPEVGKGQELAISATIAALQEVAKRVAALRPDAIIIVSPHTALYADYFHLSPGSGAEGSFAAFSAPQVRIRVNYDVELCKQIMEEAQKEGLHAGTEGERDAALDHGTMIPLYFIQQQWPNASVVRMGFSGGSSEQHAAFGRAISRAVNTSGKRVLLVASGDLSHKLLISGPYGFQKEGPVFDQMVVDTLKQNRLAEFLDYDAVICRRAAECGLRSFQILAGCMEGLAVESELLSYEGPFGVGYAVAWIGIKENLQDPYVRLARQAVEHYVKQKKALPLPESLPKAMLQTKAATFVSLHLKGRLRGCIGTLEPWQDNVAQEIIQNAISACSRDPRFSPVRPDELAGLEISVDVLSSPEPISDYSQLNVKDFGVIVTSGRKRGVLLPDLEGVDTVEEQVAIAMQKAGIHAGEAVQLQRFRVVRHE